MAGEDYTGASIHGFFEEPDLGLFKLLLTWQRDNDVSGDILEVGVLEGKSACLLGYGLRDNESLVAADMFEYPQYGSDPARMVPVFLANWRRYHDRDPEVIVGPSKFLSFAEPRFRFVHIDGGHTFKDVERDLATVASSATKEAIVALDDYCHPSYPGVAAATWGAVDRGELLPFCVTPGKLYAARTPSLHAELSLLVDGETEVIAGWRVVRIPRAESKRGLLARLARLG